MKPKIHLSVFGTCTARLVGDQLIDIRSAKHRALLAILATAPMGLRSRKSLQKMLWGEADCNTGNQNLRRALSDLRKLLGPAFEQVLHVTSTDLQLNLERTRLAVADPDRDRPFLEDLQVHEPAFLKWRDDLRRDPGQLSALARGAQRGPRRMRPSICVLPLLVPNGDPERMNIADWIAQELCRTFSRSNLLTVISHMSGRTIDNRHIDIKSVRDRLGVDYLVTGTIRECGGLETYSFDFIDAESGQLLWNNEQTYPNDGHNGDLLECLAWVVQAVGRSIAENTLAVTRQSPLETVADHRLLMAGATAMHRRAMRDFFASREYLTEACARAPDFAELHAWLGKWYALNIFKGYSTNVANDTAQALACTDRALSLSPESSFGLTIDGFIHGNVMRELDIAERRYAMAIEINPNESLAWLLRGSLQAFLDNGEAAVSSTEIARRLSPVDPFGYYYDSLASSAYLAAGDYQRALRLADRSLTINDRHLSTYRVKIAALHFLGQGEAARTTARELRRLFPEFTLDSYRGSHPSMAHKTGRLVFEALAASGLT